jgi:hypothetical protein
MHTTGYLAWINEDHYSHREFRAAEAVLCWPGAKTPCSVASKFPSSV